MPGDTEARIIRLEQLVYITQRRVKKAADNAGALAQAVTLLRDSVGDGAPTGHTVTFCPGYSMPDTITGTDPIYGALSLNWDPALTFPIYSGGTITGSYTSSVGGWSQCITANYAGYYGYPPATGISITYNLTASGNLVLYWKTAFPFTTNSQPIANTCSDINTSYLPTGVTVTCPSTVDGLLAVAIQGLSLAIYPSGAVSPITIVLPHL